MVGTLFIIAHIWCVFGADAEHPVYLTLTLPLATNWQYG